MVERVNTKKCQGGKQQTENKEQSDCYWSLMQSVALVSTVCFAVHAYTYLSICVCWFCGNRKYRLSLKKKLLYKMHTHCTHAYSKSVLILSKRNQQHSTIKQSLLYKKRRNTDCDAMQ